MTARKSDQEGTPHARLTALRSQGGQSMAEFLVILPVMLGLIFGAIQIGLIFHAKITLNYAAFEGVRAGTLNSGSFDSVKEGFSRGLAPLYSYFDVVKTAEADLASSQVGAFQAARDKVFDEFDATPELVWVERLNPSEQSFKDFSPDDTIPNDNLMYRSSAKGGSSGTSIQDANLLRLRFYYCYPLYVPYVNIFIANVVSNDDHGPECPYSRPNKLYIRLTAVAAMRMQSPLKDSSGYYLGKK